MQKQNQEAEIVKRDSTIMVVGLGVCVLFVLVIVFVFVSSMFMQLNDEIKESNRKQTNAITEATSLTMRRIDSVIDQMRLGSATGTAVSLKVTTASGTTEIIPLERGIGEIIKNDNINATFVISEVMRISCGLAKGQFVPAQMQPNGQVSAPACNPPAEQPTTP